MNFEGKQEFYLLAVFQWFGHGFRSFSRPASCAAAPAAPTAAPAVAAAPVAAADCKNATC